jgi:8-oxo-dGTP diphosphatase
MQRQSGKYDYISNKYEFPGGKVEENESNPIALMRELEEEMDLNVVISEDDYFMSIDHQYPDFHIIMHSYLCNVDHPNFNMKEHAAYQWLLREELDQLDWAPADLPIVNRLIEGD